MGGREVVARHSDDDDHHHGNPHRKGCETKDGKEGSKEERAKKIHRKKGPHTSSSVTFHTVGSCVHSVCRRGAAASARTSAVAAGEGLSRNATFTVSCDK